MSIKKIKRKKGDMYFVRVFRNGVTYSKTFQRHYDAQQFEQEVKYSGSNEVDVNYTFEQAANEWMKNHAEVRKAPKSISTDRQMLRVNLLPRFGSLALRDISPQHIEGIIHDLRRQELAAPTINRNLELVRTIFNYAIKRRRALWNPVKAVGLLRTQTPSFDFWMEGEAQAFLRFVQAKYGCSERHIVALLYLVALNTGMRMGELIALSWHDVDLENELIAVRRTFCGYSRSIKETTKGYKIRHVPINSAIRDELLDWRSRSSHELVFTVNGKPLDNTNLSKDFAKDVKKAEVKRIRFHDMRHTYASHFMMNGGDLYHLQCILGHSDIKTTMRYAHLSKAFLVDKADTVCLRVSEKIVKVDFKQRVSNLKEDICR